MNWGRVKVKVLAIGAACLALQAYAGDADSVLKVRIGDSVKELGANVVGLKPDVCQADEKVWYQANGWSCEGYVKEGIRVEGVQLRARFRMAEPTFKVANVTMLGEVAGNQASGSSTALVNACDALMGALGKTYGRGDVTVMEKRPGAVKYVVFYGSESIGETAMMVCQDNGSTGVSELVVDIVGSGERERKPGLMAMNGLLSGAVASAFGAGGSVGSGLIREGR